MLRLRRRASDQLARRHRLRRTATGCLAVRTGRGSAQRRTRFESLEDRMLLAASVNVPLERFDAADYPSKPYFDPSPEVLFAPGTSAAYIESIESDKGEDPVAPFTLRTRWTATATDGAGLTDGDPTTLTWSIADDGTAISDLGSVSGESQDPSDLVSYLGGIYGVTSDDDDYTDEPWFPLFVSVFDRWSELTGITYVYEPNDDAAAFSAFGSSAPGVLGTRGDVRIGGHRIDGGSGVLAYNFFPNNGEMVIDTADNFFTNLGSNSLRLRNVVAHEAGHGIAIRHSVSSDARFLMEPFATTAFDGPQFDDILGAQKLYGDVNEDNSTVANATSLAALNVGESVVIGTDAEDTVVAPTDVDFVSIDSDSEEDYYSFELTAASTIEVKLTPVGPTYQVGPQGGTQTTFDTQQQSDLVLEMRDTAGNLIASSDLAGLGGSEVINFSLSSAGTYLAVVSGKTAGAVQMYELEVSANPAGQLSPFQRLQPLGGLMAASQSNFGNLAGAASEQEFDVYLEAGQTIAAVAVPQSSAILSLEVLGLSGVLSSPAAGEPALLPATSIPADGTYTIRLTTDGATNFEFSAFLNASVGELIADTADGSELPINDSFISLGSGRYGVIGNSRIDANSVYEFVSSNDPSGFVDISATGSSAVLGDDDLVDITTTIGNEVFAAGPVSINSNGGILAGSGVLLDFNNGSLPSSGFTTGLLPFWDDLGGGTVYWQETTVNGINTLIVQWENQPHVELNSGEITFQLQLFESGPTLARFAYPDVIFGTKGRNNAFNAGASATVGFQKDTNTALEFSSNVASLSNDDVVDLRRLPPDIDEYEIDLTGKAGEPIDIVVAGHDGADFSGQTLELLDTDGATVLAVGVPDPISASTAATNFDLAITGFTVPADGIYTVRLTADLPDAVYGMVVTESLLFEAEPNDQPGHPRRDWTPLRAALGHLDAVSDPNDDYTLSLSLSEFVSIATETLFDGGSSEPGNSLDPELEVIHPDGTTVIASDTNSAADGKNALLSFFAPVAGTYTLRVRGTAGTGEYLLVDGQLETPPPTDVVLNEWVRDPGGASASDNPNEYFELRGPANRSLAGVYLAVIDGEAGSTLGEIGSGVTQLIDLSASRIGTNGFLVIADDASDPYTIAPDTTIVDVPGLDFPPGSYTVMLLHVGPAGTPPVAGQDLDVDDNGLDSLPASWTILDDLSVLDGGTLDRGYGQIVFSPNANGLREGSATFVDAGSEFDAGTIHHVMRIGDSTGAIAADWVAFRHEETPAPTPPDFVNQASTDPAFIPGVVTTYHLGQSNPVATDTLTVVVAAGQVSEAAGVDATTVTITRSSGNANPLTVTLAVDDSSEAAIQATATIPAGQSSVVVDLDAVDDSIVDGTQTVIITATAVGHLSGTAGVDIVDNDTAAITVSDASETEGGTLVFTVTLDNAVEAPFTVDVAFGGGTATGGVDYDNTPVTLNFAGNVSETQQFNVAITDDGIFEGDETFDVSLDASNALVSDTDTATATIIENDPRPPGIESVVYDDGGGHRSVIRSITVTFDTEVTVEPGAFVVASSEGTEVTVATSLSVVGGKSEALLTFSGALVDASGSLIDGNYRLTIVDTKITDSGGLTLDGDGDGVEGTSRIDDFFRLLGDTDGDRLVGLIDFAQFRAAYGELAASPNYRQAFDFDADDDVDLADFASFRTRYGTSLAP